jgi:signal transduction histidine kinase
MRVAHSTGVGVPTFERIRVSDSPLRAAVLQGEAVLSNDPLHGTQGYQRNIPLSAIIGVPLCVKGRIIGALDVVNKPGGFDASDIRLLSIYADQAAIAIENTRLHKQVEQIAVMEERNRLARELHDSVTQSLYGVTLYAEAAARMLQSGSTATATEYLRDLRTTAQEALREMRLLIFELRPPVLEKEGLLAALQMRLDSVEGRAGLETELIQAMDAACR